MKGPLHIGEGFGLPLDFVTQSQAILAKKRVGKSYTASVLLAVADALQNLVNAELPPEVTPVPVSTSIAGPGAEPRKFTPTSKPAMAMPTSKTSAVRPAVPTNGNGNLSGPEIPKKGELYS